MSFLINPDVAFVFLGAALLLTIFALLAPGSGILEVLAVILLIAVGYAVANLTINIWALVLIMVGIAAVILTFRRLKQWYFIIGSITLLLVGMVFLFRGENSLTGVNPLLGSIGALGIGVVIWIIGKNIANVSQQKPYSDVNQMAGMTGMAVTDIYRTGSVYVDGENWSAISDKPIPTGSRIKVVQRMGLILKVEIDQENT